MKSTAINIVEADEIKQMNLPPELVNDLQVNFNPLFEKAQEWKNKADKIKVSDINDKEGMKAAREARLELKNIRVEADKIRAKLKEESLLKGKAIDGMFNIIKFLIVPIEKSLEEQEKFAELQEEKRLNELTEKRITELSKYVEDVSIYNVRIMSEEAFNALLESQKKLFAIEQERLKKEEEERIERERKEKEEQERIRKENEQLKALQEVMQKRMTILMSEIGVAGGDGKHIIFVDYDQVGHRFETEKPFSEMNDDEFNLWVEETKKKAEAIDAPIIKRKEGEEAEKQKKAKEAEEKLKAEREAREKAEKELAEKKAAEEKAKREEEERVKKLQTAPDKDKLRKVAQDLLAIDYPDMQSEEGKKIIEGVKELMKKVNVYIVKNIENL